MIASSEDNLPGMKEEKLHEEIYVGRSNDTIDGDISTLNLGPTHPATHGIFQNV
jgi:NADH-quinone oxidoreductase subunit D